MLFANCAWSLYISINGPWFPSDCSSSSFIWLCYSFTMADYTNHTFKNSTPLPNHPPTSSAIRTRSSILTIPPPLTSLSAHEWGCQPAILTISVVKSFFWVFLRSYPRRLSSVMSVWSAISFSEWEKTGKTLILSVAVRCPCVLSLVNMGWVWPQGRGFEGLIGDSRKEIVMPDSVRWQSGALGVLEEFVKGRTVSVTLYGCPPESLLSC